MASIIESSMRRYSSGESDYSNTTLIDSPRIVALKRKHYDEIEVDVSDLMPAFIGNCIHEHLENNSPEHIVTEERLFSEIDGIIISGCVDVRDNGDTGDYKSTKTWQIVNKREETLGKWEQQLNINHWLAKRNGKEVTDVGFIEAFFLDWNRGNAQRIKDYPEKNQVRYTFKMWSTGQQEEFIRERIRVHELAKKELPLCSDKDRWLSKYRLIKEGQSRAVKVEENLDNLKEYARKKKIMRNDGSMINGYSIVPGDYRRCLEYCEVSKFCSQWEGK